MTQSFRHGVAAALAAAVALLGTPAIDAQSSNGAFLPQWRGGALPNKGYSEQFEVYCRTGYTCGIGNIEVDWDDGSAIDSISGYIPPETDQQSAPLEEEFIHYYAQNGLYHIDLSIDDDMGNWWVHTDDVWITS